MPGNDTLQNKLQDVLFEKTNDRITDLRKDHDLEVETRKSQCGDLYAKLHDLTQRFNDERVSSAKSLGSAAVGGASTAGLIDLLQWAFQAGAGG